MAASRFPSGWLGLTYQPEPEFAFASIALKTATLATLNQSEKVFLN